MAIIFHIDIDAFFASVEEILDEKLKYIPFAVAGRDKHTIISTANYVARKFGVKSAMNVACALKKCPNLTIIEPKYEWYSYYSNLFFETIRENFTNKIEKLSIDECYIDVTDLIKDHHNNPIIFANKIQSTVKLRTGLSITIGIANTKFLAKMATDLKKPFAINTIFNDEIVSKLYPLEIKKLLFVGTKTLPHLQAIGINTIGDFVNTDSKKVISLLGENLYHKFINDITGQSTAVVDNNFYLPKQMGESYRFINYETNIDTLEHHLELLLNDLYNQMQNLNIHYNTVSVHFKTIENEMVRKSKTEKYESKSELISIMLATFNEIYDGQFIKMIGLSLSNLEPKKKTIQLNIHDFLN